MRTKIDDHAEAGNGLVPSGQYVMAQNDADAESARLRLLELWHDPGTIQRLEQLGIAPGWRCLEAGAGRGSITQWFADQVGPTGSVVAPDIDPRFLTEMPDNVEVRRLDIRTDAVEAEGYDLVHCRALLMHLPEPGAALARLVSALRPGGVLLVEEGDFGLHRFGGHPHAARMNELFDQAIDRLRAADVMHSTFGRDLPAMLPAAGVELLGGAIQTNVTLPGEVVYEWEWANVTSTGPRLVAAGVLDEAFLALAQAYFGQPGTAITSLSLVAAWGRKPR